MYQQGIIAYSRLVLFYIIASLGSIIRKRRCRFTCGDYELSFYCLLCDELDHRKILLGKENQPYFELGFLIWFYFFGLAHVKPILMILKFRCKNKSTDQASFGKFVKEREHRSIRC